MFFFLFSVLESFLHILSQHLYVCFKNYMVHGYHSFGEQRRLIITRRYSLTGCQKFTQFRSLDQSIKIRPQGLLAK